jgi:tyrosine-protein phosphatase SIW14
MKRARDCPHPIVCMHIRRSITTVLLFAAFAVTIVAAPVQGVGNFQKVDDHVFRGAQPTPEGFRNLSKLGIQTVVDLREPGDRSAQERKTVTAAGMQYISVPMRGMSAPPRESVVKVLALLEDTNSGPVFVHCLRGADRTGAVIACYRVEHDKWKNDQALAEARSLGMSWFQQAIQSFVVRYQPRNLDAAAAKTLDASVPPPSVLLPAPAGQ